MKINERKQFIVDGYRQLIEEKGFAELLRLRAGASLGRFSLSNLMLVLLDAAVQNIPVPEMLHTYDDWQKLGRQVRKGEQAHFHVLAPIKKTREDEDSGEKYKVIVGWRWLAQFSAEQTDGDPLPELTPDLTTQTKEEEFGRLLEFAQNEGITVIEKKQSELGSAKGWYDKETSTIALSADIALDERLAVLVHELVHSQGMTYEEFSRPQCEAITEAAAAIVLLELGLPHAQQSLEYIAVWASHLASSDSLDVMMIFDKAEECARKLERALRKRQPAAKEMVA